MKTKSYKIDELMPLLKATLQENKKVKIWVTGDSMKPYLVEKRDLVILEKPSKLFVGDIILFERNSGGYALHRILKIKKEKILLYGDGIVFLEWTTKDNVVAKCSAVVRDGKEIATKSMKFGFQKIFSIVRFAFLKLKSKIKIKTRDPNTTITKAKEREQCRK